MQRRELNIFSANILKLNNQQMVEKAAVLRRLLHIAKDIPKENEEPSLELLTTLSKISTIITTLKYPEALAIEQLMQLMAQSSQVHVFEAFNALKRGDSETISKLSGGMITQEDLDSNKFFQVENNFKNQNALSSSSSSSKSSSS